MNQTVFRDVLLTLTMLFMLCVFVMLPWLNPPSQENDADPPGNLIAAITWPEGNTDVDLWLDAPAELKPIGYSNKGGVVWNLLRDDLGNMPDATPLNYENAYSRGIVPGEYTINVHCYRCPELPVRVDVEVAINTGEPGKGSTQTLFTTTLNLEQNHQELTAVNFKLKADGTVDPASMNNVFRPLRAATKGDAP